MSQDRSRLLTLSVRLTALLTLIMAGSILPVSRADAAQEFHSAHGIEVLDHVSDVAPRTLELQVRTDAVDPRFTHAGVKIRVTLPEDYDSGRRYPVLYLLHGQDNDYRTWTTGGADAEVVTRGESVITVMPDGGKAGWYTDWLYQHQGAQSWEEFHIEQLIPFIDENLNTIASRKGRAIAGWSMGGTGAIVYAHRHPELFTHVASFSGGLDFNNPAVRTAITGSQLKHGQDPGGPHGVPVVGQDGKFNAHDPVRNAGRLRDMGIGLYAGGDVTDVIESNAGWSTHTFARELDTQGIDHVWNMYGQPGRLGSFACNGNHTALCATGALELELPNMMASFDGR